MLKILWHFIGWKTFNNSADIDSSMIFIVVLTAKQYLPSSFEDKALLSICHVRTGIFANLMF